MTFSLPVPLTPCQVPRCHECVLSVEGGLRKAEANTEASEFGTPPAHSPLLHLLPVASRSRQLLRKKKERKKKLQRSSQRDIRFETWVFCFHMNSQAPSDRWGMEISHYERQISLLFWFCGGHRAKCGICGIILQRNYTLKNSSPVRPAEGR